MRALLILIFAASVAVFGGARAHAAEPPAVDAINLNTATERDLMDLPGIGPAKAEAIVAYRKKNGPFRRIEELDKVKGFGRKTVARLKPSLTIGLPAPLPAGSPP